MHPFTVFVPAVSKVLTALGPGVADSHLGKTYPSRTVPCILENLAIPTYSAAAYPIDGQSIDNTSGITRSLGTQ